MYRIIFFISILFLLVSCSTEKTQVVEIHGYSDNSVVVRGMWVEYPDGSILTSAHVVQDSQIEYRIRDTIYTVWVVDVSHDRALLVERTRSEEWKALLFPEFPMSHTWDIIATKIKRGDKIVSLTGSIVSPSGSVIGYDSLWKTRTLTGVVITDIPLLPWDSGAPIYDMRGNLIDLVHVQ